jgi:hypothetical protein
MQTLIRRPQTLSISLIMACEATIVALALAAISYVSGHKPTDWLGSLAVFITFLHGQLSFEMEESQSKMNEPAVKNYHWSSRLFVTKELLWLATFALAGCWPLCAGSLLFASYPHWRNLMRKKSHCSV